MRAFRPKWYSTTRRWWAAIFFCFLLFSSLLPADEVDKLLDEVRPPARFANHVPNFSATQEQFKFESDSGAIKRSLWVIKDGSRYVALWHQQASKLYMVAPTPARPRPCFRRGKLVPAKAGIEMPPTYNTGGNTFDGKLGTRITTFPYCHGFIQSADEHHFKFTGGDSFFVVMTMQRGDAPEVKIKGSGLDAKVTVGKQVIRFDGEKIILAK